MIIRTIALCLALAAAPVAVQASTTQAEIDARTLADCMIAASGEVEFQAMRRLLAAALAEDVPGMQVGMAAFAEVLFRLGMNSCGLGLSQIDSPAFALATEIYGEHLGTQVMERALSLIE